MTQLTSRSPVTQAIIWEGQAAGQAEIDKAVSLARTAQPSWAAQPLSARIELLQTFKKQLLQHKNELAQAISLETGKPLWESKSEVDAMIGKVDISVEAYGVRCAERQLSTPAGQAITRHKPHGVVAVFGPFNFPGHLPNGHIVPALLAGNSVIFKSSELTPLVAEKTIGIWQKCGLPSGVLNLLQGGRDTGELLARHPEINGLYFTGSAKTGQSLLKQFAATPQKILALEMGGNNPLVVSQISDLPAAAYLTIQSAFLTAGQRCTCARRLIVVKQPAFLEELQRMTARIQVGRFDQTPEPFMGPVISTAAAQRLLQAQARLQQQNAKVLVEMRALELGPTFLSPGIVDVTEVPDRSDEELFGPLLQLIRVNSFEEALEEANRTQYGLSAGLLSDRAEEYQRFFSQVKAGVINWNASTTGASSAMPFGGIGLSGNHRPSAFYAADYCAYPVSSVERSKLSLPEKLSPGISAK